MKFQELSDSDKQKAREAYTGEGYLDHDWWDSIYEDAVTVGKILGIEIATRGKHDETDINFSGFWSQGDGASFAGSYRYAPDACAKIAEHAPENKELLRIAQQLTALQIARRVCGFEPFSATVTKSGRYSHSGTMSVEVNSEDENDEHNEVSADLEEAVTQLMRDFADWIYTQLEAENDWLYSDECVDQYLEEKEFDETGVEV